MKKYISIKFLLVLSILGLVFTSCVDEKQWDAPTPAPAPALTNGSANFSTYVAVGNSLTAGLTDGALFIAAQDNGIMKLVSDKFSNAGGGDFTIPYMNDNIGGMVFGGNVIQNPRYYFNGAGPVLLPATPTTDLANIIPGPYNNMGVPGAKSFHLLANGYGNIAGVPLGLANPYFARMASSSNASVLEDAVAMQPTFFSLWIGANDVLSYAIGGGTGTNQTGNLDPSSYGSEDITDPNVFAGAFSQIANALENNGTAKGIVLNIPYVNSLPYFTTVPYNAVPLDAATAAQLNAGFATYNGGVQQVLGLLVANNVITQEIADAEMAKRSITFVEGQNPVTIVDDYLMDLTGYGLPNYRMATAEDFVVLPASNFIGTTVGGNPQYINGVSVPLADNWVLSSDEVMEIKTATDAYNVTIESVATAKGLAFVDVNSLMQNLANGGIQSGEFTFTNQFVFGNTFSLDGIHPTARGNAFIANEILKAIDAKYGSNFQASGSLYETVDFPTVYPANL
ncbi:MAG TPA: G-D-S-L family lipolytic protein [Flavobacteriia bacterium]|nr:G-D-S-L family lipolytic protein [Flavobacteriia bacterium]